MATWKPDDMIAIPIAGAAARPMRPERDYARVTLVQTGGLAPTAKPIALARAGTAQRAREITIGTPSRVADLPVRAGKVRLDIRIDLDDDDDDAPPWLAGSLDLSSIADAPEYVAVLREPPGARLSIKDGALLLDDQPAPDDLDYALFHIERQRDPSFDDDELRKTIEDAVRTLQTSTAPTREAAYLSATRAVATHPLLVNADRRRLVELLTTERDQPRVYGATPVTIGFDQLAQQLPATRDPRALDLAAMLGAGGPALPESPPAEIHWSTRVLDGERVVDDLVLAVDHDYALETGIGPLAIADAAFSQTLPAALFPDDIDVRFSVVCEQAVLRDPDTGTLGCRVDVTSRYVAANHACAPVRIGLRAGAARLLRLDLGIYVDGTQRASARLPLAVAAPMPEPPRPPLPLAPSAFAAPRAEVQIDLRADRTLVVTIDNQRFRPAQLANTDVELEREARLLRNELIALARAYRPAGGGPFAMTDAPTTLQAFARIGAALHALLFGRATGKAPTDLRALATAIARAPGGRLQAVTGAQWLPWALLYDGPHRGHPLDGNVDPTSFWGARFQIDRVYDGYGAGASPAPASPPRVHAFLNAGLDAELAAAGVQVVASQRALFAPPPAETRAAFETYLRDVPPCDLLYFFCHARAAESLGKMMTFVARAADDQAQLEIEPGRPISVREMAQLRDAPLPARPLVFLNACGSAAGDAAFHSPFVEQFLAQWEAIGLLGTDWEIPAAFADEFARRALDRLLVQHQPLGAALGATIADAMAAGNPYGLIYALYAPPHLTFSAGAPS